MTDFLITLLLLNKVFVCFVHHRGGVSFYEALFIVFWRSLSAHCHSCLAVSDWADFKALRSANDDECIVSAHNQVHLRAVLQVGQYLQKLLYLS